MKTPSPASPAAAAVPCGHAPPGRETTCPLCGGPNGCVPAATGSFDGDCWCRNVRFSAELLARVPAAQLGRACICRACASADPVATRPAD